MLFVSPIRARVFGHESAGVSASINAILEKVAQRRASIANNWPNSWRPPGAEPADLERAKLDAGLRPALAGQRRLRHRVQRWLARFAADETAGRAPRQAAAEDRPKRDRSKLTAIEPDEEAAERRTRRSPSNQRRRDRRPVDRGQDSEDRRLRGGAGRLPRRKQAPQPEATWTPTRSRRVKTRSRFASAPCAPKRFGGWRMSNACAASHAAAARDEPARRGQRTTPGPARPSSRSRRRRSCSASSSRAR